MDVESKQVSWQHLTASALLCQKECELLFAFREAIVDEENFSLYDGENTDGRLIAVLGPYSYSDPSVKPPVPVYCHHGLYISFVGVNDGLFVMWRVL